ncbi:MAG: diaminopimelate decarboxylase [Betaproteobacteria bacterium]|nr:diaminopimelate decarboxylase [Betaproteobacteria bacterium]
MTPFAYDHGELHAEGVPLSTIAERFGTPCYVYSRAALEGAFLAFGKALGAQPHLVCYAMKANSNLAVLDLLARLGSGFDIVSGGELRRVLAAGGDARKVVFSGVGKSEADIRFALAQGILCFNVESRSELLRLSKIARSMNTTAPVSLRVNPDVDARTHPYISTGLKENKFGVAFEEAEEIYREAARLPGVRIAGIDCHIGSQITEVAPFVDALGRILGLVDRLASAGITIEHIDAGGGLGIRYASESPPDTTEYIAAVLECMRGRPQTLLFEPGRVIVGNAGLLLTRVEYLKHGEARNFAIVDAAMNDLMRPSLYDAHHDIVPVRTSTAERRCYEVVGPVCETGDFLGHNRDLAVGEGDLLAVLSAGAYGMSMASNYNTRPRAAEVMVSQGSVTLIRDREPVESLFALEHRLPV